VHTNYPTSPNRTQILYGDSGNNYKIWMRSSSVAGSFNAPWKLVVDGSSLTIDASGNRTYTAQLRQALAPVIDADLANKEYIDFLIAGVGGSAADRILRSGDTMTGQLGLIGGGASTDAAQIAEVNAIVDAAPYQLLAEKGAVSGYTPLDGSSLVPLVYIPVVNIQFAGTWDASGGTLPPGVAGEFYVISVTGTLTLVPADGSSETPVATVVNVGDYIMFSGKTSFYYQLVPNFAQQDARYLQLAGGTVTGQIKGITPGSIEDLTRKDYVDDADAVNSGEAQAAQASADAAQGDATQALFDADAAQTTANAANANADTRKLETDFVRTGDRLDIINVGVA
jgi:hypothetical protein